MNTYSITENDQFINYDVDKQLFGKILDCYFSVITILTEEEEFNWVKYKSDAFHLYIIHGAFVIACLRRYEKKQNLPTVDYFIPSMRKCLNNYNKTWSI